MAGCTTLSNTDEVTSQSEMIGAEDCGFLHLGQTRTFSAATPMSSAVAHQQLDEAVPCPELGLPCGNDILFAVKDGRVTRPV
jgi:hypothetical protein